MLSLGPGLGPVQPISVLGPFGPLCAKTFKISARFSILNLFLSFQNNKFNSQNLIFSKHDTGQTKVGMPS
ncbi:uncharacterized protein DS421_16g550040 [Arachis hypogaea]|nr:uncharacterized protein DS421_16g550040 [Arachis hypogaea]